MGHRAFVIFAIVLLIAHLTHGDDSLIISGYHTMYFRSYKVSGDKSLYSYDNYGNDSTFDDYTNLYIRGRLYQNAFIDAQLSRDRFSPLGNKLTLEYRGNKMNIKVGSILASLVGNDFATLNKSLEGLLLNFSLDEKTSFSLVASRARGSTKVESFRGNNTPGPYYLRFSPIVEGSEMVKVDDFVMRRGVDYEIDYYTGELNFLGARIISEGSLITVSYEYLYSQGNSIYGFRLSKEGQWGITFLTRPDFKYTPPQERSREEYFLGTGTVGPFYLSYRPIVEDSETVIVDGVIQAKNAYQVNYLSGIITFNTPVPAGSAVVIRYRYKADIPSLGSKQVIGLDGKLNVGGLPLVLRLAQSNDEAHQGTAFGLQTNKNFKNKAGEVAFSYNLRAISDHFVPLESVGFFRQERGQSLALNWANLDHTLRASLNYSSGKRPYGYSFSPITSSSQISSYKDMLFNLDISLPSLPNITFSHCATSQGGSYNYRNIRDEIRIFSSRTFGIQREGYISPPFAEEKPTEPPSGGMPQAPPGNYYESGPSLTSPSYGVGTISPSYGGYTGYMGYGGYSGYRGLGGYYRGRAPVQIGLFTPGISWSLSLSHQRSSGGYETTYSGEFLIGRFNLVYIPTEKLKFSADIAKNKYSQASSSTGSIQLSYNPSEKLSCLLSIDNSTSGITSSSTTDYSTSTSSYYYGGFTGGMNQKRQSLDIQYLPSNRLSLSLRLEKTYSEGTYSSNSSSKGKSLFFTYLLSPRASLSGTYMLQNMDFVGVGGGMKSKLGYLTLSYQPFKTLPYFTLNVDYQIMNTLNFYSLETSTTGGGKSGIKVWSLRVQNPIGQDKTLFAELRNTDSSGSYAYSRFEVTTGIEFRLKQYLTWSLNLNKTNYKGQSSSQGYSATMLNSILSLRF